MRIVKTGGSNTKDTKSAKDHEGGREEGKTGSTEFHSIDDDGDLALTDPKREGAKTLRREGGWGERNELVGFGVAEEAEGDGDEEEEEGEVGEEEEGVVDEVGDGDESVRDNGGEVADFVEEGGESCE